MQLLDSCVLPQVQFASLSVLLQLHVDDDADSSKSPDDEYPSKPAINTSSAIMPEEEEEEEAKISQNKKDDEADKSAGTANAIDKSRTEKIISHAVLRESITVISPLTLIPEGACSRSMESLQNHIMEEFGFRDDFSGIGTGSSHSDGENNTPGTVDKEHDDDDVSHKGASVSRAGSRGSRVRFHDDTKGAADDGATLGQQSQEHLQLNASLLQQQSWLESQIPISNHFAVRTYQPPSFHLNCSSGLTMHYVAVHVDDVSKWVADDEAVNTYESLIHREAIKIFRNCTAVLLPMVSLPSQTSQKSESNTLFEGESGTIRSADNFSHNNQNKRKESQSNNHKRGGVVILSVGTTGPAYDLFGASSVIASLPQRLRDGVGTLAALDTTAIIHSSREIQQQQNSLSNSTRSRQQQTQFQRGKTKGKTNAKGKNANDGFSLKGAVAASFATSSPKGSKISQTQPQLPKMEPLPVNIYDCGYFKRLYMALLATILDDEDGLLLENEDASLMGLSESRDSGEVASLSGSNMSLKEGKGASGSIHTENTLSTVNSSTSSSVHSKNSLQQNVPSFVSSSAGLSSSNTGLLGGGVTSSGSGGVTKRIKFTFSRKRNSKVSSVSSSLSSLISSTKNSQDYEGGKSMEPIPFGGDDVGVNDRGANATVNRNSLGEATDVNAAELVRRTAQLLEVISLVEEEMALPQYDREDGSGASAEYGNSRRKPSKSSATAIGGSIGATGASGRFGRPAVPSDLAGFDYRPPSSPKRPVLGASGMSGSILSSASGSMTDDTSAMAGDDVNTITSKSTLSSQSSFPTLSKSKRDSTTSNRSRYVRRLKETKLATDTIPAVAATTVEAAAIGPEKTQTRSEESIPSKPPLFPHDRQPPQEVFDPFGVDDNEYEEDEVVDEAEDAAFDSEATSIASASAASASATSESAASTSDASASATSNVSRDIPSMPASTSEQDPQSPIPHISNASSHSFSEESEGALSVPESAAPIAPLVRLSIDLALNEDLTCEYKKSKLSSLSVEGTVQVRVKSSYQEQPPEQAQPPISFFLMFRDHSGHIKALQENKKFVEHLSFESAIADREFTYSISVPRENEYFPVVRYKCGSSLRPVPIRVQSRIRTQGDACRVALQISSNPQNPSELVHLTIIMGVPPGVIGESLQCNPPGGVWNETKRVVLWCVSELGGGEKFQLQAIFELEKDILNAESGANSAENLEFPVLARCQCSGAQLSNVELEVSDVPDASPTDVTKNLVRRFRVSHKEK